MSRHPKDSKVSSNNPIRFRANGRLPAACASNKRPAKEAMGKPRPCPARVQLPPFSCQGLDENPFTGANDLKPCLLTMQLLMRYKKPGSYRSLQRLARQRTKWVRKRKLTSEPAQNLQRSQRSSSSLTIPQWTRAAEKRKHSQKRAKSEKRFQV